MFFIKKYVHIKTHTADKYKMKTVLLSVTHMLCSIFQINRYTIILITYHKCGDFNKWQKSPMLARIKIYCLYVNSLSHVGQHGRFFFYFFAISLQLLQSL